MGAPKHMGSLRAEALHLSWSAVYLSWSAVYLSWSTVYLSWSAVYLSWSAVYLSWSAVYLSWERHGDKIMTRKRPQNLCVTKKCGVLMPATRFFTLMHC